MVTYREFLNKFVSSIYKLSYLLSLASKGDGDYSEIRLSEAKMTWKSNVGFRNYLVQRSQRYKILLFPLISSQQFASASTSYLYPYLPISLTTFCPKQSLKSLLRTLYLSREVSGLNILPAEVIALGFLTRLPLSDLVILQGQSDPGWLQSNGVQPSFPFLVTS